MIMIDYIKPAERISIRSAKRLMRLALNFILILMIAIAFYQLITPLSWHWLNELQISSILGFCVGYFFGRIV